MDRVMKGIFLQIAGISVVGIVLFVMGILRNQSLEYWYLVYNLGLAVIPLLLALWLNRVLRRRKWPGWLPLLLAFGWLLTLPNSFYIVTDFIHLPETQRVDIVQDVVMLMQFSIAGLAMGFLSVFLLHKAYARQLPPRVVVGL